MRELSQAPLGVTLGLFQAYHFLLRGSIVNPLQPVSCSSRKFISGSGAGATCSTWIAGMSGLFSPSVPFLNLLFTPTYICSKFLVALPSIRPVILNFSG